MLLLRCLRGFELCGHTDQRYMLTEAKCCDIGFSGLARQPLGELLHAAVLESRRQCQQHA